MIVTGRTYYLARELNQLIRYIWSKHVSIGYDFERKQNTNAKENERRRNRSSLWILQGQCRDNIGPQR